MDNRHGYLTIDLALVGGLLLQAAAALWWAADQGSDNRYQNNRLAALESHLAADQSLQQQTLDRLARIEERLAAQNTLLQDLKQTSRSDRK